MSNITQIQIIQGYQVSGSKETESFEPDEQLEEK